MTNRAFDPNVWTQALHETFAPVHRAQQEGLKAFERFTKFQYSVAGDYLLTSLAQAQAALSSRTPSEFLSKQAELGTNFRERVSARVHELAALASETQRGFTQFGSETRSHSASEGPQTAGASSARVASETTSHSASEDPQTAGSSGARGRRRRERRTRRDERLPE